MSLLALSAIYLAAAVVAVPLFSRFGFGAILGYLAAGAAIGPWGLRLVSDVDGILHFSEFGVVLLLFVIGLELQPARLWTMRRGVFGTGGLQMAATTAVIGVAAFAAGLDGRASLVVGLGLALSSTAFALQALAEKGQLPTRHGRAAFSVLLFQDLAAIPIIALVPFLAGAGVADAPDPLTSTVKVIVTIAAVILLGRFALSHFFRLIARTRIHEIFTASTLLTVIAVALLMHAVGLSMALGAFLAGVLLAGSEFRHAIKADIEPFKGLLLGLFFIAVGMSVNFGLLATAPGPVLLLVAGLMAAKFAVLFATGLVAGHGRAAALRFAAAIAQGGEFAFVIFTIASGVGVIERSMAQLLILVVTLSLALTPFLMRAVDVLLKRAEGAGTGPAEPPEMEENGVVIAGFGRFGQIVGRMLRAKKIGFTALEVDSEQVDFVTRYGNKVYYGDATRLDVLRAAGVDRAKVFVLAIDNVETSVRSAEAVRTHFPHVRILARARDRDHAYRLMDLGVTHVYREMFASSLEAARDTLVVLGLPQSEAERAAATFRAHDEHQLADQHGDHHDQARLIEETRSWHAQLEEIFEREAREDAAAAKPEAAE